MICRPLLAFLICVTPALATEWFVSPKGDDQAKGTSASEPLATMRKGVGMLKAGDTLTVLPGAYAEAVLATLIGTAEAPIVIRAQRPGTVLVHGDREVNGFSKCPDLRGVYSIKFMESFEAVAERDTLKVLAARPSREELPALPGSWFYDKTNGLLYVHASDSQAPDHHSIVGSVTNASGLALIGSRHVVLEGLAFTGFNNLAYGVQQGTRTRWGIFLKDAENVRVRNCTAFLNGGGIGLIGGGRGCVVEGCRAFANNARYIDIGNNINGWSVSGVTFRGNQVEGVVTDVSSSRGDIVFYSGGAGNVMEGNLAINAGLMVKGGQQDATVHGNIVIGRKFYRTPDTTNLQLAEGLRADLFANYADPVNHDFRLQSDSALRRTTPGGGDPGPFPYRDEVFFVSPQGDDSKAGTSVKLAWRTLDHAARQARPGDTLYVLAGVYQEALVPAHSGTEKLPIRFLRRGQDRVVIDGQGKLETGIDLSGREHLEVRGFAVRNCTKHGLAVRSAQHVTIEQVVIDETGAEGAVIEKSSHIRFAHNLVRGGGGMRVTESAENTITENLFDSDRGPHLTIDEATRRTAWLDYNAYAPAIAAQPLISTGGRGFATIAEWQEFSAADALSICGPPALDAAELDRGEYTLRPESLLIGRDLYAGPIGPFLRTTRASPAEPADLTEKVTATTATIAWWQPGAKTKVLIEWGATPKLEHAIELPSDPEQVAGVVGLDPGTRYFYRVTARGAVDRLVFSASAEEKRKPPGGLRFESEVRSFTTAPAAAAARIFHVSTKGSDTATGLAPEQAWRTLAHAAAEVRAGDTVVVHAGVYEEFITLRTTGDAKAPITFRAAAGEEVWITGSERARSTAILLRGVHYVVIDGFYFRDFACNDGQAIRIEGGSHHIVRRCFYDGRAVSGYTCPFLGANGCDDLLVENCVMIGGMGEGLAVNRGARPTVRHCVFYNNNLRALTANLWDPKGTFSFHHNLVCDSIPTKGRNALLRILDLENLRSDHNVWFTRSGPEERPLVEAMAIGGKDVWTPHPGSRRGQDLVQGEVQQLIGQEKASVFANPQIPVVAELVSAGKGNFDQQEWQRRELHRTGDGFARLTFQDFLPAHRGAAESDAVGLQAEAFESGK